MKYDRIHIRSIVMLVKSTIENDINLEKMIQTDKNPIVLNCSLLIFSYQEIVF